MQSNTYKTSKHFRNSVGEGHEITFDEPSTVAECVSSGYFPSEADVRNKAIAQWRISAVHNAAAWAEKENKRRAEKGEPLVTVGEIQDKVRGFRYGATRTRTGKDGQPSKAAVQRQKAAALDTQKQATLDAIRDGKFPKTAVRVLISVGTVTEEEVAATGFAL